MKLLIFNPFEFEYEFELSWKTFNVFRNKKSGLYVVEHSPKDETCCNYYFYDPDKPEEIGRYIGTKFFDNNRRYTLFESHGNSFKLERMV